jgi:hypothetical protein
MTPISLTIEDYMNRSLLSHRYGVPSLGLVVGYLDAMYDLKHITIIERERYLKEYKQMLRNNGFGEING